MTPFLQSPFLQSAGFGKERPSVAFLLADLAQMNFAAGKYVEAETFLTDFLTVLDDVIGPGNHLVLSVREKYAKIERMKAQEPRQSQASGGESTKGPDRESARVRLCCFITGSQQVL